MQNIELKVRHPDLAAARAAAEALGARYQWTRTQRDSYFAVPGARLKVREMPGTAEIILYRRPNGREARTSTYHLVPVRDGGAARAMLAGILTAHGVVEKVRELWLWENVRIHLDTVAGLGAFVELEGVIGPEADGTVSRQRVATAIAALQLDRCEAVPVSYRDLVGPPESAATVARTGEDA